MALRYHVGVLAGLLAVTGLCGAAGADPVYNVVQLGLTGSGYQYTYTVGLTTDTYSYSYAYLMNGIGDVTGYSDRYDSNGDGEGQDSWVYNGYATRQIGLTGSNYQYAYNGGTYEYSQPMQINNSGEVIGYSNLYNSAQNQTGQDAWLFNGTTTVQLGLTGSGYTTPYLFSGGGTSESSDATSINNSGAVVGFSQRYNSSGASLGSDAWVYNGSTTQIISLTGGLYEYAYTGTGGGTYRQSSAGQINDAGDISGSSARFTSTGTSLGYDAWIYNGSTTQLVGLTGGAYGYSTGGGTYQENDLITMNAAGQAIGYAIRYNSSGAFVGTDGWVYSGGTTQQIGLTGAGYQYNYSGGGVYQQGRPWGINSSGQVEGDSNRYNSSGNAIGIDAWIFNGSGTQEIGLTGSGYEYAYGGAGGGTVRDSQVQQINDAGDVTGLSVRWSSSGGYLGQDAWVYDGSSTQLINLTGGQYEHSASGGNYRSGQSDGMNSSGEVIGNSQIFTPTGTSLGDVGWVYVPGLGTTPLEFSIDSANGDSYTNPEVITDSGVVLGSYDLYSGSTLEGVDVFEWSESGGFHDLGSLVAGGLTAQGWQQLAGVEAAKGAEPRFILGNGQVLGQPSSSNMFLAVVPEPTMVAPLAMGMLLMRRRRR